MMRAWLKRSWMSISRCSYSFYSNNSFRVTATSNYEGENVEEVFEGSYSFDEADLSGMTLKLELFDPDFPNEEPIADPFRHYFDKQ